MEMQDTANRFRRGDVRHSRLRPYRNKVWQPDREGLRSSEFNVLPGNERIHSAYGRGDTRVRRWKNSSAVAQVARLSSSSEQRLICATTSEISFT